MLKMVDGTGIIGVDMICPLGISAPQPPNYDRVELEGTGVLVLPNSLDAPLERLELGGKTEQVQTSGKQLFDAKNAELNKWVNSTGIIATVGRNCIFRLNVKPNTVYQVNTLSASCTFSFSQFSKENVFLKQTVFSKGTKSFKCTTTENVDYAYFLIGDTVDNINGIINDVMLYEGEEYKNYEQYTGGKPSPSPEYPQEIKSVGRLNEDTGKYEVDIEISGNFFDVTKVKTKTNLINNGDGSLHVINKSVIESELFGKLCPDLKVGETCVMRLESTGLSYISINGMVWDTGQAKTITQNILDSAVYFYGKDGSTVVIKNIRITRNTGKNMEYTPYKKPQLLTLTSDRPLTKWDRLVEQGGEIGWLYKHKIIEDFSTLVKDTEAIYGNNGGKFFSVSLQNASLNYDRSKIYSEVGIYGKDNKKYYIPEPMTASTIIYVSDTDTIMIAKEHMHYKVVYETVDSEFIPLPQSEQNAIRQLRTYYPTTVITVDGGELDPDIKVTYRKEI